VREHILLDLFQVGLQFLGSGKLTDKLTRNIFERIVMDWTFHRIAGTHDCQSPHGSFRTCPGWSNWLWRLVATYVELAGTSLRFIMHSYGPGV